MKQLNILVIITLLPIFLWAQNAKMDTFKLFYLGGQSNMDGFGSNKDLPKDLNKTFQDVLIFHGNPVDDEAENGGFGKWDQLKPGHGYGFSSDEKANSLSTTFGLELSFALKMQKLYPGEKIALIKYSKGGSSLDTLARNIYGCWDVDFIGETGINQFDHFLSTLKNALTQRDINGDGREDHLEPSGILWMQGESDAAYTEEIASRYYANLKRLMDMIRASLHRDDIPIVIGKISDSWNNERKKIWLHGELVQYAQEKFVRNDRNAAIIRDTRYYKYSDPYHYDSAGYIDLGEKFAEVMYLLLKK